MPIRPNTPRRTATATTPPLTPVSDTLARITNWSAPAIPSPHRPCGQSSTPLARRASRTRESVHRCDGQPDRRHQARRHRLPALGRHPHPRRRRRRRTGDHPGWAPRHDRRAARPTPRRRRGTQDTRRARRHRARHLRGRGLLRVGTRRRRLPVLDGPARLDDASTARILRNVAAACGTGAQLVLLEFVVPLRRAPHVQHDRSDHFGMLTGSERGESECRRLLIGAGFGQFAITPHRHRCRSSEPLCRRTRGDSTGVPGRAPLHVSIEMVIGLGLLPAVVRAVVLRTWWPAALLVIALVGELAVSLPTGLRPSSWPQLPRGPQDHCGQPPASQRYRGERAPTVIGRRVTSTAYLQRDLAAP